MLTLFAEILNFSPIAAHVQCVAFLGFVVQTSLHIAFFVSSLIGFFPGFLVLSWSREDIPPELNRLT